MLEAGKQAGRGAEATSRCQMELVENSDIKQILAMKV
jgi:hypothetical protein